VVETEHENVFQDGTGGHHQKNDKNGHSNSISKQEKQSGDVEPKAYRGKCLVCCKVFSAASDLKKHSFTHSGEKSHICEVCNKISLHVQIF
jgi:uncharacterized Zn-finger protein